MTVRSDQLELDFLDADGQPRAELATVTGDLGAPPGLRLRQLELADGQRLCQLQAMPTTAGGAALTALGQVDNEILAGLRLHRLVSRAGQPYPPQLSQLYGYEADSAEPFALLVPWRGRPVSEASDWMPRSEISKFQTSLLKGLSWLASAGIAHRHLAPTRVRWDSDYQEIQLTGFTDATVFGVPRTAVGVRPWAGPEQEPATCHGSVGDRDDLWAVGQLLAYLHLGETPGGPADLRRVPGLSDLIADLCRPAEQRPGAGELLTRVNVSDPVPAHAHDDVLAAGRDRFRLAVPGTGQSAATAPAPQRRRGWLPWLRSSARSA